MLDVFEALVLLDRFDTFDGLVDLKLRGMPPGAAMAKDGFAVAADPAIDFPLASNRAWEVSLHPPTCWWDRLVAVLAMAFVTAPSTPRGFW